MGLYVATTFVMHRKSFLSNSELLINNINQKSLTLKGIDVSRPYKIFYTIWPLIILYSIS